MQIECGIAWSVLLLTTMRVITVVRMLWTHEAHHISICFFTTIPMSKEMYFSEHELKKALRDILTRAALSGLLSTMAN